MKYNPDIHHRHSIRLKNYDYSEEGYYFVTICVNNRSNSFGGITAGKMVFNNVGQMIFDIWDEIPKYYGGIDIDEFQIMPNHIHGIVIVGAAPCGRPEPDGEHETKQQGQARGPAPTRLSLSNILERFKSLTTKKYINGVKSNNWQPFNKRLWQRNYYEHVIRDEEELNYIREYIVSNPDKWEEDEYYAKKTKA